MSTEPRTSHPLTDAFTIAKGECLDEIAKAVEAEREACAKIADEQLKRWPGMSVAATIAAAIRARKS